MKVCVTNEYGKFEALIGLGLSYGLTSEYSFENDMDAILFERLKDLSNKLAHKDKGHNKFLESICVWIDITAPRNWWSQFDTYRIGVTKQSESSMHTLMHRHLTQDDFEHSIYEPTLDQLNKYIDEKDFTKLKNELPEGFLQRRIICTNYKVLRHIIAQRKNHKLPAWPVFVKNILTQVKNGHYLINFGKEQS